YSDRRLKNIGKAFTAGLEEIKKLDVFNYTFKNDEAKTPRVGVIAQDLQKIFPQAVFKGEDGFLRIRMEDMFYALVNAVKELDAKIEGFKNNEILTLKNKIDDLEEQNKELIKANKKFEKRLEALEKSLKNS
ncbi:tail fiber domain-containing protein, partial [bacterium]|nr:tail fiber domain-containing protein [bacterium]